MAHSNPAHDRYHAVETYRSQPRAARRVAQLNAAGYRAYMVVVGRQAAVHISEGRRSDLFGVPRIRGAR